LVVVVQVQHQDQLKEQMVKILFWDQLQPQVAAVVAHLAAHCKMVSVVGLVVVQEQAQGPHIIQAQWEQELLDKATMAD
jgi:hypothetical protein